MHETDVLILGAGISGLSCRAGLAGTREVLVLEAADEIGGLLRVHPHGDFTFDTTVHAVFFREARTRRLFELLVPGGFHEFTKHNLIWQAGQTVEYPYQFHLSQLPERVRRDCVETLPATPTTALPAHATFEAWLLAHFGAGLYRHFFEPYNHKLYGVHPSRLEAEPMVWTIPTDHRDGILAGARGGAARPGARVRCLYPRGAHGIAALPRAMAAQGRGEILCGERVARVDVARRTVTTARGLRVRYRALVSTLPMPVLARSCRPAYARLRADAATLDVAPITVVQIGARERNDVLPAHWTYFPDGEIPFYRMTRFERIAPDLCPPGATSLLLECPGEIAPARDDVLELLVKLGVLTSRRVACYDTRIIPCAYVRFLRGYSRALARIHRRLREWDVRTLGRYGEWRYANIEQCVLSGLRAAASLARRPSPLLAET